MATLYIMCGQAFSGKSTLAKEIARYAGAALVSQDAIWFEKEGEAKLSGQKPDYHHVLEISRQRIREALKQGRSAVFDNTNAGFKHREELRQIAHRFGAEAAVVYLNTSDEELNRRQGANRVTKERHDVNEEELKKVRDRFEVPSPNESVLTYLPGENVSDWLKKSIKP
ncbi:MAG TPA: ATP-binding protein [Candidatus Paceibacterota bacterium]|nr:ATP-binding protein [Candidatus Paceibacterota bacterium]